MKQVMKKILVFKMAALLLLSGASAYATESIPAPDYYDMVLDNILQNYKFEVDTASLASDIARKLLEKHPEMLEEIISITADKMDRYSEHFTPAELDAFSNLFHASYVGIGVVVQRMIGSVGIVSVTAGSPAEAAGVLPGDRIVKVNGQDVTDFTVDELTPLIIGDAGSKVELTLLRDGNELTLSVLRAEVRGNTVGYQKVEDGIGYLQIASFNDTTPTEIGNADSYFRQERVKKLIIDLRDNPGGEVISVVHSLSYFVPKGKDIISIYYGNEKRNTTLRSVGDVVNKPYYDTIVVLVNGETASGGELFAGNIRDYGLGTLVGVTTLGKGTVQEFMSLPDIGKWPLGAIKLTTAEYVLPGGDHINGVGIKPEHWVANRKIRIDTSEMEPVNMLRDYREGDTGSAVLALKQRFNAAGAFVGEVNDVYDREMTIAVRHYQKTAGLPATGVMDYETTKQFLTEFDELRVVIDEQLQKALELVRNK